MTCHKVRCHVTGETWEMIGDNVEGTGVDIAVVYGELVIVYGMTKINLV